MFRALSLAAAVGAFLLAVLGSWVRINGAGMTCPDWPLCHGQLLPSLANGVIFEWSHRLVALVEGVVVIAALAAGWQVRKRIAGVVPAIAFIGAVFIVQVALGGLTVALSNSPWSVVLHWGTGMLFLAGLFALAILAVAAPRRIAIRHSVLGGTIAAAAGLAFAAMCAGAFVSSSGAGLACSSLPGCDAASWTGNAPGQAAQMTHRALAGAFFVVATIAAYAAALGTTPRVRIAVLFGYALVVLQVMFGFANVAWGLPMLLREIHAANAGATFLAFVAALVFAALDGTKPLPSSVAVRTSPHATSRAEVAR
jgi:heme A synthase